MDSRSRIASVLYVVLALLFVAVIVAEFRRVAKTHAQHTGARVILRATSHV